MFGSDASVSRQTATVVGLIAGSQFVNHTFLVLLPPILPVLSADLGVSLSLLGVAMGAQALVNTVFQLPFGYLADSYDRTLALGLSSVVGAGGALVTAVASSFPELLVGQLLVGIGVAGHHPAHYPLLSDATTEDTRGRAFAVYNFGGSLGFATPPVVVTAVTVGLGLTWRHAVGLLGAVGLVYGLAVTAVVAWRVDDDVTAPNVAREASSTDAPLHERVAVELRAFVAEPGVVALAVVTLLASTASWGLTSYVVVFLTDVYDLPLSLANLVLTGLFVVGAGAILVSGSLTDRFGGGRVLVASTAGATGLLALVAAGALPAAVVVALVLLLGGVRSLSGPARDALTERLSASGAVGKSFALVTVGLMLGNAVAPPVFGYLIQWAGVRTAFLAIAGVALAATAVTLYVVTAVAPSRSG